MNVFKLFISIVLLTHNYVYALENILDTQEYPSYLVARDAIITEIKKAKEQVILISSVFVDGDLSTALLSAKLKGVIVKVILNPKGASAFNSQHTYLINEAKIPVYAYNVSYKILHDLSTIVIDNSIIKLNTEFNSKTKGIIKISPSQLTINEIMNMTNGALLKPIHYNIYKKPKPYSKSKVINNYELTNTKNIITIEQNKKTINKRGLPNITKSEQIKNGQKNIEEKTTSLYPNPEQTDNETDLPE